MQTLHCSAAGFVCEHVIQADTVEEVLAQAAEHARQVHGVEVTPEMAAQIKTLITSQPPKTEA